MLPWIGSEAVTAEAWEVGLRMLRRRQVERCSKGRRNIQKYALDSKGKSRLRKGTCEKIVPGQEGAQQALTFWSLLR